MDKGVIACPLTVQEFSIQRVDQPGEQNTDVSEEDKDNNDGDNGRNNNHNDNSDSNHWDQAGYEALLKEFLNTGSFPVLRKMEMHRKFDDTTIIADDILRVFGRCPILEYLTIMGFTPWMDMKI